MSDVDQRLADHEVFISPEEERSGKQKKTLVIKEKIVMSPRRAKKKPNYIRQNTFNLEEDITISPLPKPKKQSIEPLRAKSSYGIKAILERAESISGLTPQVKEYLSAHMRMMGQENARLMIELANMRQEVNVINSNCDKQLRTLRQQLDKEKAKNKLLMAQVRANPGTSDNDDVIIVTSKNHPEHSERQRSASVGANKQSHKKIHRPRSSDSLGSLRLSRPGTPLPASGEKTQTYNNNIHSLEKQIDRLKMIVQREVGEDQSDDIINGKEGSGWRGRAETIENQKRTISVLEELLSDRKSEDNLTEPTESEAVQMKKLSREFRSLNQAAEVERQRLSELVTLLTGRLKAAEDRLSTAESGLRLERQRCARAELALERAQIDLRDSGSSSGGRLNSSVGSQDSYRRLVEVEVDRMTEEELRWEVVRLKEELRAVSRELGEARGAREEMVRIYKQMLEDTRQIYRQNLTDN